MTRTHHHALHLIEEERRQVASNLDHLREVARSYREDPLELPAGVTDTEAARIAQQHAERGQLAADSLAVIERRVAELDASIELLASVDLPPASQLPAGWQRFSDDSLEELLSEFVEPYLTDDEAEEVADELDKRRHEAAELVGHHRDQLDDEHNHLPAR